MKLKTEKRDNQWNKSKNKLKITSNNNKEKKGHSLLTSGMKRGYHDRPQRHSMSDQRIL